MLEIRHFHNELRPGSDVTTDRIPYSFRKITKDFALADQAARLCEGWLVVLGMIISFVPLLIVRNSPIASTWRRQSLRV